VNIEHGTGQDLGDAVMRFQVHYFNLSAPSILSGAVTAHYGLFMRRAVRIRATYASKNMQESRQPVRSGLSAAPKTS
jgi:hypothetical protein